jgi:hypothetical protein
MKHYIGPFLVLAALGCGSVSPAGGDDPGTGGAPKAMSVAGADGGEAGAAGTAPDAGEPQGAAGTAPDGGAGAAPDACGPPVLVVSWTITDLATLAPVSCTDIGSPDIRLTVSPQGGGTEFAPFGVDRPLADSDDLSVLLLRHPRRIADQFEYARGLGARRYGRGKRPALGGLSYPALRDRRGEPSGHEALSDRRGRPGLL